MRGHFIIVSLILEKFGHYNGLTNIKLLPTGNDYIFITSEQNKYIYI
jgi:hypothetical protein